MSTPNPENTVTQPAGTQAVALSPCQMAIGYVIFDAVCLAVGGIGLRKSVSPATIESMAVAAGPVLSTIEKSAALIARAESNLDKAKGVWTILTTIYNGGMFGAVASAFISNLSWWDALLYGTTAIATVVAAFATDGLALIAEMVVLIASFGFLVSDSVKAVQACGSTFAEVDAIDSMPEITEAIAASANPLPFEPELAIRTVNGHLITVANNGGLDGDNNGSAFSTNRQVIGPWEKFTVVPLDQNNKTFALKTVNGQYVTAVNGGGMGGPNDASCPIRTDATNVGPWESLVIEMLEDGTYAFSTTDGYYLTAVNGGGVNDNGSGKPMATNRTQLGPWETFTLDPLPHKS